jgi:DNA-binding MarR family transcriptional regulator
VEQPGWTLLSNHGHVLVCLAQDPDIRVRDIADAVGITQRAVQGIIADLVEAGFVDRERTGRRNHYELHPELPLRHPLEEGHAVGELLAAIASRPVG